MLLPTAQLLPTRRCKYAVSAAIVPVLVITPPVSPVPAVMLLTYPPAGARKYPPRRSHVRTPTAHLHADLLVGKIGQTRRRRRHECTLPRYTIVAVLPNVPACGRISMSPEAAVVGMPNTCNWIALGVRLAGSCVRHTPLPPCSV